MKKKLLAGFLALALLASMSTAVFAAATADSEVENGTATITVATIMVLPTIDVYISAPPSIVVNPYKMSYSNSTLGISNDKSSFMSTAAAIINKSTIGITVTASPTATVGGNVALVDTAAGATGATDPKVFMFMHLQTLEKEEVTTSSGVTTVNTTGSNVPSWASTVTAENSTVVIKEAAPTDDKKPTLDMDPKDTDPTYAGYKIIGESGGAWKTGDTVGVSIVFTFTPKLGTGSSGS